MTLVLIICFSFNGHPAVGIEALDKIHMRASYELYEEVLLVRDESSSQLFLFDLVTLLVFLACVL